MKAIFIKKVAIMTTYFFNYKGGYHMKKEPIEEVTLPEIKRRKRKVSSDYAITNISYRSLFDLYLRECKIKNLSETTIKGYEYATKYFLDYAGYNLMCYDVTQELINNYYLHLQQFHKATTINSYVFKVSPTILYGVEKGYITEQIEFTHMVEQETIKDIYTQKELELLLKRPTSNDFCEFRAWVIINTFLGTGIRAKELRNLKVRDVNLEQGYITVNITKNKEARIIPIPSTLHVALSEWLQVRNTSREDYLFCNIYGEQIQRTVLQTLVKRYSIRRGVNKYGLHLYRHTFITLSVRKGMSPVMLKRITGHKNIKMLDRYYSFNPIDLVNIVDEYNPLEDFKPKQKKYENIKIKKY